MFKFGWKLQPLKNFKYKYLSSKKFFKGMLLHHKFNMRQINNEIYMKFVHS
jgi:hypothetical protein